jgi:hypothetical protein
MTSASDLTSIKLRTLNTWLHGHGLYPVAVRCHCNTGKPCNMCTMRSIASHPNFADYKAWCIAKVSADKRAEKMEAKLISFNIWLRANGQGATVVTCSCAVLPCLICIMRGIVDHPWYASYKSLYAAQAAANADRECAARQQQQYEEREAARAAEASRRALEQKARQQRQLVEMQAAEAYRKIYEAGHAQKDREWSRLIRTAANERAAEEQRHYTARRLAKEEKHRLAAEEMRDYIRDSRPIRYWGDLRS